MPRTKKTEYQLEKASRTNHMTGGGPKMMALWSRMEDRIGKERLIPMLEGSLDQRFHKLLREIMCPLPALQRLSIRQLAARNGISYNELMDAYRQTNLGMILLDLSEKAADVVTDTIQDAKSQEVECNVCWGEGMIRKFKPNPDGEPELVKESKCKPCWGTGKVKLIGDIESRKLVFEAAGLTKRGGGGVQLNQQFVNWGAEANESLEALVKDSDSIVDGTVVEITPTEEVKDAD